jgi:hypothetical protein
MPQLQQADPEPLGRRPDRVVSGVDSGSATALQNAKKVA